MPALVANEELIVVRTRQWRFAVRLADVERVLPAAMPVALPSSAQMAVRLPDGLVPVIFSAALFGAADVALQAEDKMLVLKSVAARTILWVDAVEDVVPFVPVGAAGGDVSAVDLQWVSCLTDGDQTLAVLDPTSVHGAAHP